MCLAGWQATTECFVAASCAELNEGTGPCWDAYQSTIERCILGEDGCDAYVLVGTGDPPGTCTFGEDCIGQPGKEVHCEGEQCVCQIGGEQAGSCPADDICDDLDAIEAKIAACCG
jgi:hypothetical protein